MAEGMTSASALAGVVERPEGEGHYVELRGRIDVRSAADLRPVLHRILDDATGPILLDLGSCEVGDATGLGLVVECLHRARRLRRQIIITEADARTRRLLRRVRLGTVVLPRQDAARELASVL